VGTTGARVILDITGPSGHRIIAELDKVEIAGIMAGLIEAESRTTFREPTDHRSIADHREEIARRMTADAPFLVDGQPGYVVNEGL